MSFRPMPLLSLFTVLSLGILGWLGNWQHSKFVATSQAASLPDRGVEFERISGDILISDKAAMAQQVLGKLDGEQVWRRFVPLVINGTDEIVLLGIDASGGPKPIQKPLSDYDTKFEGQVVLFHRLQTDSVFAFENEPENNLWYSFDPEGISTTLGLTTSRTRVAEQPVLVVESAEYTGRRRQSRNPYLAQSPVDRLPPERHLGYALTWWGLGLALIGVYIALHRSKGRLSF